MLVEMSRGKFETLDDAALVWACVEPTILKIRGRSPEVKVEVSRGLNEAQRAVLMFQVLYGHARGGAAQFFTQLSYLLSRGGIWSEFKRAAGYFGDEPLQYLLEEMEKLYSQYNEALSTPGEAGESNKLTETIGSIDPRLIEILPGSLRKAASAIRSNPGLFVQFTD